MALPTTVVFRLFDTAGAPMTGQSPTFDAYIDDLGVAQTQPAITELSHGFYKFSPTVPAGRFLIWSIHVTAAAQPYGFGVVSSADFADTSALADDVALARKYAQNDRRIVVSGPDANREVFYDDDGITPLSKHNLYEADGTTPTTASVYRRVKVP